MSLLLYSKIPGTQVKRDANLSNVMVQCDPTLLFPQGATQAGVPLNKENLAGKLGVEHDICNLDLNNLTVNGVLVAKGPAEICDIVCPQDFTVTAGNDIRLEAANDMVLLARNDMGLEAVTEMVLVAGNAMGLEAVTEMVLVAGNDTTITTARDMALAAGRDMALAAGRDILIGADNQVKLAGNTQGVQMAFDGATDTDVLRMTNANVNSAGPANAQTVTASVVTGTIQLQANTAINALGGATDVISCTLTNNKITTRSTVLYSVNIDGNNAERIVINGGGTTAGSYEFVLANLGTGNYVSSANDRIVISFLVIEPAI